MRFCELVRTSPILSTIQALPTRQCSPLIEKAKMKTARSKLTEDSQVIANRHHTKTSVDDKSVEGKLGNHKCIGLERI